MLWRAPGCPWSKPPQLPRRYGRRCARCATERRLAAHFIRDAPNLAERRLHMLLRNAWYIVAWADEIGSDQPLARRICNEPIVLFRGGTGRVGALTDRCCHRAAPLSMGSVVEEGIQCGYHGLVIDGLGP